MQLFWKPAREREATEPQPSEAMDLHVVRDEEIVSAANEPEHASVEALVDRLTDRRTRVGRGLLAWAWLIAGPVMGFALIATLINGDLWLALLFLIGLATSCAINRQLGRLQEERAALRNSDLGSSWLGPLCEALEWPATRVRNSAKLLLKQFLPRIRAGDDPPLTAEQGASLYGSLTRRLSLLDPELVVAILRSLPYIGTEAALPYVNRLASVPELTPSLRRVRRVALGTLAELERRVARQRANGNSYGLATAAVSTGDGGVAPLGQPGATISESERAELAQVSARVDAEMRSYEEELRKLQNPGMRHGFLIAVWIIVVPYFAIQCVVQFSQAHWPFALLCGVMAAAATQAHRLTMTDRHKSLASRLVKLDDVRCIGRLSEALEWPDAAVRQVAIIALTRLLRRVKASDRVPLTARQRGSLHRMLTLANAARHSEFMLSILAALEQIGDASAVPFVEQLSKAQPVIGLRIAYPGVAAARERQVREAAHFCLEALKWRAELSRTSQTLLRASAPTVSGPNALLRPASAASAFDHEQLLRAGADECDLSL